MIIKYKTQPYFTVFFSNNHLAPLAYLQLCPPEKKVPHKQIKSCKLFSAF